MGKESITGVLIRISPSIYPAEGTLTTHVPIGKLSLAWILFRPVSKATSYCWMYL